MSRIGKIPVKINESAEVSFQGAVVTVRGPKGSLSFTIPLGIAVKTEDNKIVVSTTGKVENVGAAFGLTRALIANMVKGVTEGFAKELELSGVGYRAQVSGTDLILSVGFSHPVKIKALPGIQFSVADNVITVSGIDKILVGDTAAKIRNVRPPEPYKGKGIRYIGERIRRKAGKAAKAVGVK